MTATETVALAIPTVFRDDGANWPRRRRIRSIPRAKIGGACRSARSTIRSTPSRCPSRRMRPPPPPLLVPPLLVPPPLPLPGMSPRPKRLRLTNPRPSTRRDRTTVPPPPPDSPPPPRSTPRALSSSTASPSSLPRGTFPPTANTTAPPRPRPSSSRTTPSSPPPSPPAPASTTASNPTTTPPTASCSIRISNAASSGFWIGGDV
mmetsp:Transcript_23055/g.44113  ORF Transcript_23055/g.44113 Transcript_23055/m.44113 type:complete len:205 (+) Transcript_23055:1-615(+)